MKFKSLLAATALICASSSASAISVFEGKVKKLLSGPNYGQHLYIQVDRNRLLRCSDLNCRGTGNSC